MRWWKRPHHTTARSSVSNTNNRIVIAYHATDHALACALDTQLQILVLKLPQFTLHYFEYPSRIPTYNPETKYYVEDLRADDQKAVQEYQARYQRLLDVLANPAVFVPCLSPLFLRQFWKDIQSDEMLHTRLSQSQFPIEPVLMRPVVGANPRCVAKPLAAYEKGYELEHACSQVVEQLEVLLTQLYRPSRDANGPLALLLEEEPHQRGLALR